MVAKVASQCPFVSATCVLGERCTNLVSNNRMFLALWPPQIITIIPFKSRWEHISVWISANFFDTCHHKSHDDLVFNETLPLHLGLVHIMVCHCRG